MKKFQNFYEYNTLEESLNTPVEFYLTDDTQLPVRIYGAFKIDDDLYGMSLEQSDHTGIYILQMYRILAKKPRKWSFKKPSHVRPALSTLLKFMEACVPFVKSQMKGIMITVSGKNTSRYVKFAERVLRRSYITSFKVLPTVKPDDKKKYAWESIFVSRIGVSPSAVFSDSKFKKYNFSDGIVGDEIAADIEPKRPEKRTVKTEPSKRYTFGQLEIENITIDSEIFDMITKVEQDTSPTTSPSNAVASKEELKTLLGDSTEKLTDSDVILIQSFKTDEQKEKIGKLLSLFREDEALALAAIMRDFTDRNPNSFISDTIKNPPQHWPYKENPEYVIKNFIMEMMDEYPEIHEHLFSEVGELDFVYSEKITMAKEALALYKEGKPNKTKRDQIVDMANQFEKTASKKTVSPSSAPTPVRKVFKTNISPEQLESTVPGTGTFTYLDNWSYMKSGHSTNVSVDKEVIASYLEEDKGYAKAIRNHKHYDLLYDYTGPGYKAINRNLRVSFETLLSENPPPEYLSSKQAKIKNGDIDKLNSMIEDMPPLEDSLWVYRGTSLPETIVKDLETGSDFVDPAFLSTSIRPDLDWMGSHRFRIFIPKGSKVIPALSNSDHVSEYEIVLPPFSVLKIIRVDDFYNGENAYFTCIYVGSVYSDFKRQFLAKKVDVKESSFIENKNVTSKRKENSDYDMNDKFSVKTDKETLRAATKFARKVKKAKK